ncbi:MAG: ABC transporter ATP-binding protein [Hyphomicrobiales bacterium]
MSTEVKNVPAIDAKRLVIRNMNKHYGTFHAVKDLDIEVEPGEFLVLLGPSGCGKSTALRMIAGLEEITSGEVIMGDRDVTNVLPKYRDIAMVFQSYALYPHKTVAENIGFPLKVAGVAPDERDKAVHDAAAQVQMETLLARYPRELSGGQRQRVALARAIIRRPSAFLMDEPLSNLDAKLRGFMRAELKHMQHELGVTTIYVTHDQIEAMTLAHRVAIMRDGVLQQLGTPAEVYTNPVNLFVAGFMGSPPMNFVEGDVNNDVLNFGDNKINLSGAPQGSSVTLGFRPEDATVVKAGKGRFDAKVYTAEMTGDLTLVTMRLGKSMMTVKMPKDFMVDFDELVGIDFPSDLTYLFTTKDGARLSATVA